MFTAIQLPGLAGTNYEHPKKELSVSDPIRYLFGVLFRNMFYTKSSASANSAALPRITVCSPA